ncbi:MAG: putative addiction module antidote protein [Betaproteobacteria bacterium]|nr:putative addiction module antidote protein [Betaproteobacteria bacterium]
MPLKTSRFDIARHLETDADIAEFLTETLREGDAADFIHALGTAARARGMTEIAKKAGVSRASLYKSLSENGNPEFDTIYRLCNAMGLRLTTTPLTELTAI